MYRFYSQLLILLLCLVVANNAGAQDEKPLCGFGMEANVLGGRIIKHTKKFLGPIPPLSGALDMNFIWQTYGKKDWHRRRNYPVVGFGVTFSDYGNNAVYGQAVGIYTDVQMRIISRPKFEWTFRIGDGIGCITKKYQSIPPYDTLNNAIGSTLNDFAIFMTDIRYKIDDHWNVQAGLNFTHISNADFHQPNLGINMGGTHVGIRYFPVTCRPKHIETEPSKLKNRWLAEARFGNGWKEARAKGNPILPTYVGSAYMSKRWQSKNKFFFGADYAYHKDVYAFLKNYGVDYGTEKAHSWDGAVFAGNEFLVGRVGIMAQVGYYYHQTFLKFDPVYEKLGGNFYFLRRENGFTKELFITAMLVTHGATAEYAEFGVGAGF